MSDPSPQIVRDFWAYMLAHYSARLLDKRNAFEALALTWALIKLGLVPSEFASRYTTTVANRIYAPFEPGVPAPGWGLWDQILVCAHECQHIIQYRQLGAIPFALRYAQSAGRTLLECDAYRVDLELHHWRTGRIIPPAQLSGRLVGYGVSATDLQVAERYLMLSGEAVRRGAIVSQASKVAIDWLKGHAAEVRET